MLAYIGAQAMLATLDCPHCVNVTACPFATLPAEGLLNTWNVRKKQLIYRAEWDATSFYVVRRGSVKLLTAAGPRPLLMSILRPGDWFGLDALLSGHRRRFAAIARESSVLCCVDRVRFLQLATSNFQLLWRLIDVLNRLFHDYQQTAAFLLRQPVRRRLQNALAIFEARSLTLSQVELADFLGVSSETICREMRKREQRRLTPDVIAA